MKKIWSQIPDFNDTNAKVSETYHTSGAKIIEVLYGAKDAEGNSVVPADVTDGHGKWTGIEIDDHYVMLSHTTPVSEGATTEYGTDHAENALVEFEKDLKVREDLCNKAEVISKEASSVKKTGEAMELRRAWNAIYTYGTPRESELQNIFNGYLETYFTNRDTERKDHETKKAALIEQAKTLSTSTDYKKTAEEMDKLFAEWKATGSAGADQDEALWNQFKDARDTFFKNRKEYFAERKKLSNENAEVKRTIISEAKTIIDNADYSKEQADLMNQLMEKWKAVGYVERNVGEKLWEEFKGISNSYWQAKKKYHAEQHQQWLEKKSELETKRQEWLAGMREALDRKKEKIAYLTGQNETLKDRIERTFNPDKKDQIAGWVLENESKISQLESDIKEIEEKLAKG